MYDCALWLVYGVMTSGDANSSPAEQWDEDVCFLSVGVRAERRKSRLHSAVVETPVLFLVLSYSRWRVCVLCACVPATLPQLVLFLSTSVCVYVSVCTKKLKNYRSAPKWCNLLGIFVITNLLDVDGVCPWPLITLREGCL